VEKRLRAPRRYPCVDVDDPEELEFRKDYYVDPLGLEKALFQYSWIRRRVFKTRHGYHVYLLIDGLDAEAIWRVRALFGDDWGRLQYDESRIRREMILNRCFTSSELFEFERY